MTRTRTKYSIFCQKKPKDNQIKAVCVFLENQKIWVVCIGKLYANGNCRYWYNGIEGISDPFSYKVFDGYTDDQIYDTIVNLNLNELERWFPLKKSLKKSFNSSYNINWSYYGSSADPSDIIGQSNDSVILVQ